MFLLFGVLLFAGAMAQEEEKKPCFRHVELDWQEKFRTSLQPDPEKVWEGCLWQFTSPEGSYLNLACEYHDLPEADACLNDRVVVSKTGDPDLTDLEAHCGPEAFETASRSNILVYKWKLSRDALNAKIDCSITVRLRVY